MAGPGPTGGHGPADPRTTSEVLASLVANIQALVQKEIELAKLEARELARDKGMALGLAAVAGVFGLLVLAFIGVTAAKAFELIVSPWLAWLFVTLIYLLVAAIAIAVAVKLLKKPAMEKTKETAQQTAAWAKAQPETVKANIDTAGPRRPNDERPLP